jgi:arginase
MPQTRTGIDITYVPADCGSMIFGKSKAPTAFQTTNLATKLREAGIANVSETWALEEPATWRATPYPPNGIRNEALNLLVNTSVQETLQTNITRSASEQTPGAGSGATADDEPTNVPFQLIIGGECCMLPGVLSGLTPTNPPPNDRLGLLYIDADVDLSSPFSASSTGNFASMTMTHLTHAPPGALSSFTQAFSSSSFSSAPSSPADAVTTSKKPLCDARNTLFFSTNLASPTNTRENLAYLFTQTYRVIPSSAVAGDPEKYAREALQFFSSSSSPFTVSSKSSKNNDDDKPQKPQKFLIHLDVDAIDAADFPLANVPQFTGVTFEALMTALEVMLVQGGDAVVGLCVAEVNPDHDPGLEMVGRLGARIAQILGRALR